MNKLNKNKKMNKRAQVGETTTWIVATLIIVVVLILSIYAASILAKSKGIAKFTKKIVSPDYGDLQTKNLLATKSLVAYLLTKQDGETIYSILKKEGTLGKTTGPLAERIFMPFADDYKEVWLGLSLTTSNDYFGDKPQTTWSASGPFHPSYQIVPIIKFQLKEGGNIELILKGEK